MEFPLTEIGNIVRRGGLPVGDLELNLGHVNLRVPIKHPCRRQVNSWIC